MTALGVVWICLFALMCGIAWLIDIFRSFDKCPISIAMAIFMMLPGIAILFGVDDWSKFITEVIFLGAAVDG